MASPHLVADPARTVAKALATRLPRVAHPLPENGNKSPLPSRPVARYPVAMQRTGNAH